MKHATPRTMEEAFGDSNLDVPPEPLTLAEKLLLTAIWLTSIVTTSAAVGYVWRRFTT